MKRLCFPIFEVSIKGKEYNETSESELLDVTNADPDPTVYCILKI